MRLVPILLQKSKIARSRKSRNGRLIGAATAAKPYTANTRIGGRFYAK